MRCEDVQEILDRCDLGDEAAVGSDVQAHVQECRECREFASDIDLATKTLSQVPMERFSEVKSRELKAQISALEATRAPETESAPALTLGRLIDQLAYLVAGPRLAWGVGALGVLAAAVIGLHLQPVTEPEQAALPPIEQPVIAMAAPVKTHPVELVEGDLLVSGLVLNISRIGKRAPQIHLPEGRAVATLPSQKATILLSDGTKVGMAGATQVKVADRELILASGAIAVHVKKQGRGFKTVTPTATALVMGTRYTAGEKRVELVEGSVDVKGENGQSVTLKPGQQAVTAGPAVAVSPIDPSRVAELHRTFSRLDSKEELAHDLSITVAKLEGIMNPVPAAALATPPKSITPPAARPTRAGSRLPVPGEMTVPDYSSQEQPAEGMAEDGAKQ